MAREGEYRELHVPRWTLLSLQARTVLMPCRDTNQDNIAMFLKIYVPGLRALRGGALEAADA